MTNTGHMSTPGQTPRHRLKELLGPILRIPTPVIFAGSVILAIVILWVQGSGQRLADAVQEAEWGLLLVAAPIYVFSLALLCLRWHLLVIMAQGHSNLPRASEAFLTSVVINYAAPIGLAVPSRAALTKRALGLDARSTGTIAIWEIGMDVIVLGLGSLLWLAIADGSGRAIGTELSGSMRAYAIVGILLVARRGGRCLVVPQDSRPSSQDLQCRRAHPEGSIGATARCHPVICGFNHLLDTSGNSARHPACGLPG